MATETLAWGTRTALTITLASLGNAAYREATEIDQTASPLSSCADVALQGKITTGTSPTSNSSITIYAAGSDGASTRIGNITGTDSTVTPSNEQTNFRVAHVINVDNTSNHQYEFYIPSLAAVFDGRIPKKWSIIVLNSSGVALNATGGNHDIEYTPLTPTIA